MSKSMDPKAVWERYVASWKVQSPDDKRALFEKCLATECSYCDPVRVAQGWDSLLAYMAEFQEQVPGAYFVTEYFATHHQKSIARWRMLSVDAGQIGEGLSYGEYDANGFLVAMSGFFETTAS